jgi:thiol-disulfide isomerase/thioredoxin
MMRIFTLATTVLACGFSTTVFAQQPIKVQIQGQVQIQSQGKDSFSFGAVAPQAPDPEPATVKMPELADARLWFNSKPLNAKGLRGHVVLIDFWAYDCPGCIQDLPNVLALNAKYHDKGLQVIAVQPAVASFHKDSTSVEDAIKTWKIPYPIVYDSTRKIADAFKNNTYPMRFYVDKQGNIRNMNGKSAEAAIEELLAEKEIRQ